MTGDMAIHDSYARRTPYELALPGAGFVEERFPAIAEEAEAREVDARDPGAFVNLAAAGDALRQLRPPDEEAESIHRFGSLLFHAFHFWREGRPLWLLSTHVARYLVDASPPEGWEARLPAPAGYLQLPRHLFWSAGEPPEPVDGIFWTAGGDGSLSLLVTLGMRPDRPGLSVVPLPPIPLGDAGAWAHRAVRGEGEDFETTLPGGEIEHLYSMVAAGEAVKLAARAFWFLDTGAGAEEEREPEGEGAEGEPPPSALPYRRVGLE